MSFLTYPETTPGGEPARTVIVTGLLTEPCTLPAVHSYVPESATRAPEIEYSTPVNLESRSYTFLMVRRSDEGSEPVEILVLVCYI